MSTSSSDSPSPPNLRLCRGAQLSCDDCKWQEGRHYCLLHSTTMKNMDIHRCDDFEEPLGSDYTP